MIGSGLKKLAKEYGMNVSHGVAYGSLGGFAATMSEGSNYKQIVISAKFTEAGKANELLSTVNQRNISREFRVQKLDIHANCIDIVFLDQPGTMKKIRAFIEWFLPLLTACGASGVNVCAECGAQVTGGSWKLINGVAHHMHESCGEKVSRELAAEQEEQRQEAKGSYVMGFLGALLGAALGAVVWACVLNAGYVASVVGLLIGWLAEKGYTLLKGKQGKGKVVILAVAVILGVLLGTIGADVYTMTTLIASGEAYYLTYADIPAYLLMLFLDFEEYRTSILSNVGIGLLFAALGVFALLRKTGKEVSDTKVIDLA